MMATSGENEPIGRPCSAATRNVLAYIEEEKYMVGANEESA